MSVCKRLGVMALVGVGLTGCGEDPSVGVSVAKTGPAVSTPSTTDGKAPAETPVAATDGAVAEKSPEGAASASETTAPALAAEASAVAFSDANGSTIGFVGSKKVGPDPPHNGGFKKFTGTFVVPTGTETPTLEMVTAEIDMNSIWSDNDNLTGHLRNQDFFEVDKYPGSKFETTSITAGGENGATHTLIGNLTLHGTTKSITIPATVTVTKDEVALKSEFVLNKQEFGMTFTGPGGVIRDEVVVKLDIKAPRGG